MHSISHVCTLHLHVSHLPEGLFGIPLMYLDSDSTCPPQGVVGEKSIDIQPGSSGLPSTGAYAEAAVDAVSCGDGVAMLMLLFCLYVCILQIKYHRILLCTHQVVPGTPRI